MINFLQETKEAIAESKHTTEDIVFIGSLESGHSCTWEEFCKLSDFVYDNDYCAIEIASDLVIIFSDDSYLKRQEYDGMENWKFINKIKIPEKRNKINSFKTNKYYQITLAEINP